MKQIIFYFIIILSYYTLHSNPVIIDHKCVQKFETIPDNVLPELARLRVMFRHASVGTTINSALDCLQGTRNNPAECKNYPQYKYDRRNFICQPRGNSGWYGKVDDFVTEVENQLKEFDVFSFKSDYKITIKLNPNQIKANEIKIYNTIGTIIKYYRAGELNTDIINIDLNDFNFINGVYFLILTTNKEIITKKFIVLK
mgnify:CR=1 FL=1